MRTPRVKRIIGLTIIALCSISLLTLPIGLSSAFAQEPILTMSIDSATLNRDGTVTVTYSVSCSESGIVSNTATEIFQEPRKINQDKGLGDDSWRGRRYGVVLDNATQYQCEPGIEIQITQTVVAVQGSFLPRNAVIVVL